MQPVSSAHIAGVRILRRFLFTVLSIELLDELVFGAQEAAWPLIRTDLGLSYAEIGFLISVPSFIANLIEPFFGLLGGTRKRRALILCGGIVYTGALFLLALGDSFALLLLALLFAYPANGVFVNLSQASLMDADPLRHEENMARWDLFGTLGNLVGPLLLTLLIALGLSWRAVFLAFGVLSLFLVCSSWRLPHLNGAIEENATLREGVRATLSALRRKEVLRWCLLLEFANLLLDIFLSFLALYFVDVVGASESLAGLAVGLFTGVGLLGDVLLLWLLKRVSGLRYLRVSAYAALILFPAFLLSPWPWVKLFLVGLLGLVNTGWYSVLQGRLYSALPNQSAVAVVLAPIFGLLGALFPLMIGFLSAKYGLTVSLWLLLLAPLSFLFGLPRD